VLDFRYMTHYLVFMGESNCRHQVQSRQLISPDFSFHNFFGRDMSGAPLYHQQCLNERENHIRSIHHLPFPSRVQRQSNDWQTAVCNYSRITGRLPCVTTVERPADCLVQLQSNDQQTALCNYSRMTGRLPCATTVE
jgi:hypothetical protein